MCNYDIHDAIITYGLDLGLGIVNYNGIGKILLQKYCCKNSFPGIFVQKHSHVNYLRRIFRFCSGGRGAKNSGGCPKFRGCQKFKLHISGEVAGGGIYDQSKLSLTRNDDMYISYYIHVFMFRVEMFLNLLKNIFDSQKGILFPQQCFQSLGKHENISSN